MPREALPEPLALSPFRVREALALGVGASRLRASDLCAPFHGVRSIEPVAGLVDRCRALVPTLRPGSVFSHSTAAALWGLPLPREAAGGDLHVVSARGERRRRVGVAVHAQSTPVRGVFVQGLPVVDPVRAWLQCAGILGLDDVIVMGDALAGRWSTYAEARERPVHRLADEVRAWGRRRGSRRLHEALPWVRDHVWSPKETELRLLVIRAGLPEPPERNAPVTTRAGLVLGHADLVYREQRLAIEYEGDGHRVSRAQWRRDVARYESFQDSGWRVIRVTDDDLVRPRILLDRLHKQIS